MRLSPNVAIIAAAGARKTQTVIDAALADPSQRVLITTYTNENLRQLATRIEQSEGVVPAHVRIAGWFSFLLSDGVRPYQRSLFNEAGVVAGLNFVGQPAHRLHFLRLPELLLQLQIVREVARVEDD